MGTPIIKGKDVLGSIKTMRSGGRSSSTIMTRAEKLAIKNSGMLGKRAVMNPNASFTPAQLRKVLKEVRGASAQVDESHRQFATWKDTGTITRRTLKALSEDQAEESTPSSGEGKSDWEQKLEEKKEEAKRKILEVEAKGKEEAALRRVIAKRGQNIASESLKEEIREEQQKEIQAEQAKLADKDPKKLAQYAIDIPD